MKSWAEFRFLPGAREAVARLSAAGVRVFVITNQAIVNRGLSTRDAVDMVNRRMIRELERCGGHVEAVAYCPHRPDEQCVCRKPAPGMLLGLAEQHGIDLRESVVIGDALNDIEAGQAAGCDTILVLTGRGNEQLSMALATGRNGFRVAADLPTAVDLCLARASVAA